MAEYQVIARKYRPQTFSGVVGQEAVVTTLKNAIRHNVWPMPISSAAAGDWAKQPLPGFLPKRSIASPGRDFEPCNECPSCLDITPGQSLDVMEIDGASNRGIDDIRQINETVGYASATANIKFTSSTKSTC